MLYDVFSTALKFLSPIFVTFWAMLSCAALECTPAPENNNKEKQRCANVIGLENQQITIQTEDIINNSPVIYGEQEYCIISYTKPSTNSNANVWKSLSFDVMVDGDSNSNSNSNSNSSRGGNGFELKNGRNSLPVAFKLRGGCPSNGNGNDKNCIPVWEESGPRNLTKLQQGAKSCDDKPFSQAWIRLELLSYDLNNVLPGSYSGKFSVNIGQDSASYHSAVDFTVNLPTLVKISGLDDMVLTGRYNNDQYRQEEPFCVFVSGGGDYRIKASGGAGSKDPFLLYNGSNSIPYQVSLSVDGSSTKEVAPNEWLDATNGSSSLTCNGSTNTKVRIIVRDDWIRAKPTGDYKGTLYLTVEPA